jgi:hypothetical protein
MSNHLKNFDYKNSLYAKRRGCRVGHTGFFFSYIFQSVSNNQYLKHFINSNVITPRVLRSPAMFIRSLFIRFGYALNNFKKSLKQHCYSYAPALSFSGLMTTNYCTKKHTIMNRGYVTIKDVTGDCHLVVTG